MTIQVLVNGAFGRMGQIAVKAVNDNSNLTLVGQTGREYDLKSAIKDSGAEVVVDFTLPNCVYENTLTIINAGARPVIGTSGLTLPQVETLKAQCLKNQLGGIIAPNFSIGGILMMKYAREMMKFMTSVEIIEMHHETKADSPSGTAIRTAEMLSQSMQPREKPASQETLKGARGAELNGISIHSVRLPGLLAHQQIIFGNIGETLTLRHDSIDRQCFIPGISFACEKVMTLDKLVYGLEDILV